jgi:hypothetical protein
MADQVFVHVGTMKSGTSYLQALCNCNMDLLAESGVLWKWSDTSFQAMADLLGTRHQGKAVAGAWAALKQDIDAWDGDVLISNELLAEKDARTVRRLVEGLDPATVQVVITARDLARTIPSQWQTSVRNKGTVPFAHFVDALMHGDDDALVRWFWRKHDLARVVRRYSRVVPAERISVVTVPAASIDFTLLGERFGAVLGLDTSRFVQPPRLNVSMGAHSAELLRRLNGRQDFDHEHYRLALRAALGRQVLSNRAGQEPAIGMTTEQLAWARERATALIAELAASGVRISGDLADLMPAATPVDDPSRVDPSEDQLLDVAMDALLGMGKLLADLRMAHDDLVHLVRATLSPQTRQDLEAAVRATYRDGRGASDDGHLLDGILLRRYLRGQLESPVDADVGRGE